MNRFHLDGCEVAAQCASCDADEVAHTETAALKLMAFGLTISSVSGCRQSLIIFVWTPPHFWALAIHRRDDYARADVPMLPVTHGVPFTSTRILQYTVGLVLVTIVPFLIGMSGWLYLTGAAVLGGRFIWMAARLRRNALLAMPTFRYSIVYLSALFALLLVDRYVMGQVA